VSVSGSKVASEIARVANQLGIPSGVAELALSLMSRVSQRLVRGFRLADRIVAFLYLASELSGRRWSRYELVGVCNAVGASPGTVRRIVKVARWSLGLSARGTDAEPIVRRVVSELGLPSEVGDRAADVVRWLRVNGLTSGRNPYGVVAGVVYLVARDMGLDVNQADVARAAGVSTVTLRARARELSELMQR